MTEFNRQEIFNKAYEGLKAQGFKQSTEAGACMYRGPHGLKCAAGHLIDDAHYDKAFEGRAADQEKVLRAMGFDFPTNRDCEFLRHLQFCHDDAHDPHNMIARLEAFANRHGLTVPVQS